MSFEQIFLGWDRPCLQITADRLIQLGKPNKFETNLIDLSSLMVVLPGGRAKRRLLEILVDRAEQSGKAITPPRLITAGSLPEELLISKEALASDLVRRMVWVDALRKNWAEFSGAIGYHMGSREQVPDITTLMGLAKHFDSLYVELAGNALNFDDVAGVVTELFAEPEAERWRGLSKLWSQCLTRLKELGLTDKHAARISGLKNNASAASSDIILVATVDMPQITRRLLATLDANIKTFIFAPPELAKYFETDGTLVAKSWLTKSIEIADEQISIAESSEAQAQLVVDLIAKNASGSRVDEVTIGICEDEVVAFIERSLGAVGITTRLAAGEPVTNSAPLVALHLIAAYLSGDHFSDLAALVRHPDINRWLRTTQSLQSKSDLLSSLDLYQQQYLQSKLTTPLIGSGVHHATVSSVIAEFEVLLGGLRQGDRPLSQWANIIRDTLLQVYGIEPLSYSNPKDKAVIETFEALRDALIAIAEVPTELAFTMSAAQAIKIVIEHLSRAQIAPVTAEESIELLGWLELLLDDAPHALLTTFNEGFAPESVNSDPFLPDSVRTALGLLDNERRYARDAYVLSAILTSRKSLDLICARQNLAGEPLRPSRLLFACDDSLIAKRLLRFSEGGEGSSHLPGGDGRKQSTGFDVPRPKPLDKPVQVMRVTGFKRYLECPFRYYLENICKLDEVDDEAVELDAPSFGSLLHEALADFGSSPVANSPDRKEIVAYFEHWVTAKRERFYGQHVMPAVTIQLEQIKNRLNSFAACQAERAKEGWKILEVEHKFDPEKVRLDLGSGLQMGLTGRIDRIDYNEEYGEYFIIDYKSSENASEPNRTHRIRDGSWIDLQLPAYHFAMRAAGNNKPIRLGYACLPADGEKSGIYMAEWSADEIEQAVGCMRQIALKIYNQQFWPPSLEIADAWQARYQFGLTNLGS